ncbi:MAG: GNAT family N-acetyltransferase [Alphaproteobacteria bacterium]|nr:GNAT family N-acetyltransferase [Alphaproteobacteria bacterium]
MIAAPAVAARVQEGAAPSSAVTIRFTRSADDLAARVALARRAYGELNDGLPYDEDRVRRTFERKLKQADRCLLQAELGGRVIGGLIGAIGAHYHSPALGASLQGLYVLPEHRGSLAAVKLLHGFRRWAKGHGAVRMYVGVTSGIDIARTDRLLKRLGFRVTGGNYEAAL